MTTERVVTVNLIPGGFPPRIKLNQYDAGTVPILFEVYDGDYPALVAWTSVLLQGTKPSGLGFSVACTPSASGDEATVTIPATVTEEAGNFPAELVFFEGDDRVGTANLDIWIEPSPHPAGTTDGDIESAKTLVEQMQASVTEAQGYATTAAESAADVAQAVTDAQGYAAAAAEGAAEAAVEVVTVTGPSINAETGKRYIFDGSASDLTVFLGNTDKIFDMIVTAASSGLDLWIDGLGETLSFPPGLTVTEEEGIYGVTLPGGYTYEVNIMSRLVLLEAWA